MIDKITMIIFKIKDTQNLNNLKKGFRMDNIQ